MKGIATWRYPDSNPKPPINHLLSEYQTQTKIRSSNFHSLLRYPFHIVPSTTPPQKKRKRQPALVPCWALAIGLHHPVPRDLGPNPSTMSSCLTRVEFGTCTPPAGEHHHPHLKGEKKQMSHDRYCWRNPAITSWYMVVYPIIYKVLISFIHPRWFSRRISEPSTVGRICDQQPRKANDPDEIFRQSLPPLSPNFTVT